MNASAQTGRDRIQADAGAVPKRWEWLFTGFRKYCRRYAAKHFHAVRVSKSGLPPRSWDGPAVMVVNHPSWWDPILMFILTGLWPDRKDFGPIEANALKQYRFLSHVGLFGVETGSPRGAIKFLRTSRAILDNERATLWVTAQGSFTDVRSRPVRLRRGVGHLAAEMSRGVLIPVAFEYVFWNERTPEALIAFGSPIQAAEYPAASPKDWTARLEAELAHTLDQLATDAQSRDASRFVDLVRGRTGVGGMYDAWRRLKAMATGQRFEPSHSAVLLR